MKKVKVENNIFVVARNSAKKGKLDYCMQLPDKTECYMFTRNFSAQCYSICRAGVPVNSLLHTRSRNRAVMKLAGHMNFMMPYFVEYFDLKAA